MIKPLPPAFRFKDNVDVDDFICDFPILLLLLIIIVCEEDFVKKVLFLKLADDFSLLF